MPRYYLDISEYSYNGQVLHKNKNEEDGRAFGPY